MNRTTIFDASKLALPTHDLSPYFVDPTPDTASKIAALINNNIPSDASVGQDGVTALDSVLTSIIQQLILSSFAYPERIDEYVTFLSYAALQINSSAVHPGTLNDNAQRQYKTTVLRPSFGPGILGERLSKALFDGLWDEVSRAVTPDEDEDSQRPKQYYYQAFVQSAILARAFALGAETFRESLWRDVEEVVIKGLFSGEEPEPGVYIVLSALLLGAGKDIQEFMGGRNLGQGKAWIWYDDVKMDPEARWGWNDIVQAIAGAPDERMRERIPDYVKESFELAKRHVASGLGEDWDSKRLANEAFAWASSNS